MRLEQQLQQKPDNTLTIMQAFEIWGRVRYHGREMNSAIQELRALLHDNGVRCGWINQWLGRLSIRKYCTVLLLGCISLTGVSASVKPPMPPKPKPMLQSPRAETVQVNAVMVRGVKRVMALALPLPSSKLDWDYDPGWVMFTNFTVWESQDLKTWTVIGTVTAPLGIATATEFSLGYSIYNAPKPKAFWKVSAAWKEGML